MKKCVIVGSNSYLAQNLENYFPDMIVYKLNHRNWLQNVELLKSADYVINFCINPNNFDEDVDPNSVIDVHIARELLHSNALFFFLSSRKVYGRSSRLLTYYEESELKPFDFYSRNKLRVGTVLKDILGPRLSILRISNILGNPEIKEGYNTFMGWITKNFLEHGRLVINQSKFTVRDFITKRYFHYVLSSLVRNNVVGVHNISSNINIPLGTLLGCIVGNENVIEQESNITDQFLLSNEKIYCYLDQVLTKDVLIRELLDYRNEMFSLRAKYQK